MKWVDRMVDFGGGLLINIFKYDRENDPLKMVLEYKKYKPMIERVFKQTHYWHGTGRFHYQYLGESKYHSGVSDMKVDVLMSVIKRGGLQPQYDFWTGLKTVSFTRNRIYARAYAEFHQFEQTPVSYVYGTTGFWFWILGTKQAFTGNLLLNIKSVNSGYKDKTFLNNFSRWASYVQNHPIKQAVSFFTFYKLRSSIRNNYGIVIGINNKRIKEVHYNPTVERFESRCTHQIKFEDMTHIEVPLRNVKETENILRNNKISVPVISMEYCEMYCNLIEFSKLAI